MKRGPLLFGVAFGFLLGATNCGPVSEDRAQTSILVRLNLVVSDNRPVHSFFLIGTRSNGSDVFQRQAVPSPQSATPLTTGSARVMLPDSMAGELMELLVYAQDASGNANGVGTATVTPVLRRDTEVQVTVRPFVDEVPDGGVVTGGDAGYDAGQIPDSGFCQCDGGCCTPNKFCTATTTSSPNGVPIVIWPCGQADTICGAYCNNYNSNGCFNGQCRCGSGGACGDGTACILRQDSGYGCVCNENTNCPGCCNGNNCVQPGAAMPNGACGRASQKCDACPVGTVPSQCVTGVCLGLRCDDGGTSGTTRTCLSGNTCVSHSGFPMCETPAARLCVRCDPFRADHCNLAANNPCACGDAGQCPPAQYCDRTTLICRGI